MGYGRGYVSPRIKKIAKKRINILFELALKAAQCNEIIWARRYIELARKIGMRATIPVPKKWRPYYCKKCYSPMISGKTARYRIRKGRIIRVCLVCGHIRRVPLRTYD